MSSQPERKFDSFMDVLEFGHSLRFPGKESMSAALAHAGLYQDRSHAGISDRENDFFEMREWLKKNLLLSKSDDSFNNSRPEPEQRKFAAGLVRSWESYKLSFIASKNKPWVNPFGIESSLVVALAKDFSDETIEKVYSGSTLSGYCIKEAKAARDAGIMIHQAYGSWRLMAKAFYDNEIENGLVKTSRPQFVIEARKLINAYNKSQLVPDREWNELVETHILADITPDHVFAIYEQIRKLPKESDGAASELYGKIFETHFRINKSGLIVNSGYVDYALGDKVMINFSREIGVIESLDETGVVVMTDVKNTVSFEGISIDIQQARNRDNEHGL